MRRFKFRVFFIIAALLVFLACGSGCAPSISSDLPMGNYSARKELPELVGNEHEHAYLKGYEKIGHISCDGISVERAMRKAAAERGADLLVLAGGSDVTIQEYKSSKTKYTTLANMFRYNPESEHRLHEGYSACIRAILTHKPIESLKCYPKFLDEYLSLGQNPNQILTMGEVDPESQYETNLRHSLGVSYENTRLPILNALCLMVYCDPYYSDIQDYVEYMKILLNFGADANVKAYEVEHCPSIGGEILVSQEIRNSEPLKLIQKSIPERKKQVLESPYNHEKKKNLIAAEQMEQLLSQHLSKEERPRNGKLFVETEPEDTRVRILNIVPRFYQGIELEPGRYHVEVSASGYEIMKQWVDLGAGENKYIDIRLKKVRVAQHVAPSGKSFTNSIGMKFMLIPAGSFMMGSPSNGSSRDSEEPQHRVTIGKPFYMQTTEVTHGQWREIMGNNPSHFKNCGDDCPAERVSWNDAQEFIRKLNQREGANKYRLPTEAEWEYACRAGSTSRFCFGDGDGQLWEYAWYSRNSLSKTHPVGWKEPNAWGLYDMHGNVWEWCQDWKGDYPSGHVTDPTGPSSGSSRVLRGGSWIGYARCCWSAFRGRFSPGSRYNVLGFRLARTL